MLKKLVDLEEKCFLNFNIVLNLKLENLIIIV